MLQLRSKIIRLFQRKVDLGSMHPFALLPLALTLLIIGRLT